MPEVHGRPQMVWMGRVGCYDTGGHKNKVWEGPIGQGSRYIGRHVNDGFLQKKKRGHYVHYVLLQTVPGGSLHNYMGI